MQCAAVLFVVAIVILYIVKSPTAKLAWWSPIQSSLLMVGSGGGVPNVEADIRLGDVVVRRVRAVKKAKGWYTKY
jgi:hypothetical protein